MTITRNQVNGSYCVSAMVDGYLVTRVFYGYTKREAMRQMRAIIKGA